MSAVVTGVLMPSPIRLRKFTWLLAGFWTFAIALVLLWEILAKDGGTLHVGLSGQCFKKARRIGGLPPGVVQEICDRGQRAKW